MARFESPTYLQHALFLLAQSEWTVLAGGTDFFPALGGRMPSFNVLDISNIEPLKQIEQDEEGNWHIGALVRWSDILRAPLPPCFDGLKLAAREVGSVQIQNRATLIGNICNASPAADGVPPLLTLGAIVKIGALGHDREMPLADFITGNRKTDLKTGEMVTGIVIPASKALGVSSFLKLGARKYLVISISMVAVNFSFEDREIVDAAIAVGSCSLVAQRLRSLEARLIGCDMKACIDLPILDHDFDVLAPIDDVRSTKEYRMHASQELVCRAVQQALRAV